MRLYIRTSRRTGISLGPVALLVLWPFLAVIWAVYGVALLLYGIGLLIVRVVEAIGDRAEQRQQRR